MERKQYEAQVKAMSRKEQIDFLLEKRDELCSACVYNADCKGGGVRGGPNGPIYPPCADGDDCIDDEHLFEVCVEIMVEEEEE